MNLLVLLGAVLLVCVSSAFGRSLNTQREIQGLTPNPPSLNSKGGGNGFIDFLTALSWPIPFPDTHYIPGASLLPITSPGMPSVVPDILSALPDFIVGPSTETTSTIPKEFLLNWQNMKNKEAKYCIYELSADKRQLDLRNAERRVQMRVQIGVLSPLYLTIPNQVLHYTGLGMTPSFSS